MLGSGLYAMLVDFATFETKRIEGFEVRAKHVERALR